MLLAKQARKVGLAVILVIAGIFIAMKARVAWYGLTQWGLRDDMLAVSGIVGLIDYYAFWLSVIVGIIGWAYISSRHPPKAFHPSYRKQLHRFFLLWTTATAVLIAAVISDGVLTGLRFFETEISLDFLIPLLSMAIEFVGAGILVLHIRRMTQRTASAVALLL